MTTASPSPRGARTARLVVLASVLAVAACGGAGDSGAMDSGFATDGDSGAPAPATAGGYTPTTPVDSTTGVAAPSGGPGVAGVPAAKNDDVTDRSKNPRP